MTCSKNIKAPQGRPKRSRNNRSVETVTMSEKTVNLLINLYNQGEFSDVIELALNFTKRNPEALAVWNILGAAAAQIGELAQAAYAFKKVISLKPDFADAHNNMGNVLNAQGKHDKAVESYKKALLLKPDYSAVYNNMGNALKAQGKHEEAIESLKKALSLKPDHADAYYNIGNLFRDRGKYGEAVEAYKKALSLRPDFVDAHNNMGNALNKQGKHDDAIEFYKKALLLKPEHADSYYNIGNSLKDKGEYDEAIDFYKKTLSLKSDYVYAHNNMGSVFKAQGKQSEAISCFQRAISLKPDYGDAHRSLSSLVKYQLNDSHISDVSKLLNQTDICVENRYHLLYAFAKMNEDVGNYKIAFDSFVEGGALRKKSLGYCFSEDQRLFEKLHQSATKFKDSSFDMPKNSDHLKPIFIVGMPRSGTTLAEQIISCHSQVQGAGELPFVSRFGFSIATGQSPINKASLENFSRAYLSELTRISDGKPLITDKMPQNFQYIGLIFKTFPEAKIIHVRRDPAATCWSNFKHFFGNTGLGYSYSLEDTANYFKLYKDLMTVWHDHYGDRIYQLNYDQLTINQEYETRGLIEYLGLTWEQACLLPQDNRRVVKTSSQLQVRKQVYKGSSGAWLSFQKFLGDVFADL